MSTPSSGVGRVAFYGRGQAYSSTTKRQVPWGLRNLIQTNKTTGAGTITQTQFTDMIFEGPATKGSLVTDIFCSANFMGYFNIWGSAAQRVEAGQTRFGVPIVYWTAPFLQDARLWYAPMLQPGTACGLNANEARFRVKTPVQHQPYPMIDQTFRGSFFGENCVHVDAEYQHSWLEGVTGAQ